MFGQISYHRQLIILVPVCLVHKKHPKNGHNEFSADISRLPIIGIIPTIYLVAKSGRKTRTDCIAWNFTNLLRLSNNKNNMPVTQPSK